MHLRENDELLAAGTGHHILRTHRRAHAARAFPQDMVATGVAVLVVDLLEMIEIAIDQSEKQAVALGRGLLQRQKMAQAGAVPQLGQRIEHALALLLAESIAQLLGLL